MINAITLATDLGSNEIQQEIHFTLQLLFDNTTC